MQDKPRDGGVESKRREVCVCECVRAQSCLILCDPMDCSPPGFSVHGKETGVGSHPLPQGSHNHSSLYCQDSLAEYSEARD